jgi:hypothetical protein
MGMKAEDTGSGRRGARQAYRWLGHNDKGIRHTKEGETLYFILWMQVANSPQQSDECYYVN